jgi:hypothetical protein
MASQGPLSPGTLADSIALGGIAVWSNPGNAAASDDVYATANPSLDEVTHTLKATNFGFSIPSGATIDGIVAEVERKASINLVTFDAAVRIVKADGSISTTERADSINAWPTSDAYASYGSPSDKWGEVWTDVDINDVDFGAAIQAQGGAVIDSIDHIRITVYYTTGGGPPPEPVQTYMRARMRAERTVT